MVAALALAPAGCGAGTVDRQEEVRALVATCRSIQERATGRPAAPVDATAIEELLAAEPGAAGDRSVASTVRRVCAAATRTTTDAPGPGPWVPLPFPERPGR